MSAPPPILGKRAVRWAGVADAAALAAVLTASSVEPWSAEALRTLLDTPGNFGILIEQDDDVAGFVLARVAADEAEILTLAVRPTARRRGYGRMLLHEAMDATQFWGAVRLFLEVSDRNIPAQALYTAAGLEIIGRRRGYYRTADGAAADALIMRFCFRSGN